MEGEREAVEDDGDEGGSPAQGLGGDAAVMVEDVVAVVADEEAAAGSGFGVCDHEESGGSIMGQKNPFFLWVVILHANSTTFTRNNK